MNMRLCIYVQLAERCLHGGAGHQDLGGLGFRVLGFGFRGLGFWVLGFGF